MKRKKCYIYMRVSTAMQVVQPGSSEGPADKVCGISEDGYCPGIL